MQRKLRGTLLSFLLFPIFISANGPIIETKYGKVRGFTYEENEKKANVFLGIPFAQPPVGDLRFEKPRKPEGWTDILEANKYRDACPPHHRMGISRPINEDCLYLNIMTPFDDSPEQGGYPVLIWIHGGGYSLSSAAIYKYENITKNFVSRGMIFVSIQYRLGPYGFLSSGDAVMPGNLGYWDQTAALEYVKENIASFGGDPNHVTVFGQSAGGSSVSALSLSPHSYGLFQQAIQMSGSTFAEWSLSDSVVEATYSLAAQLQCNTTDSSLMKECLKTKSVDEIFDAVDAAGESRHALNFLKYQPHIDGDFFPKDLETLAKEAPPKPTIIGMTEKEGIFFITMGYGALIQRLYVFRQNFELFGEEKLIRFLKEVVAPKQLFGDETERVQKDLIDFYLNDSSLTSLTRDYKFYLEQYTKIFSDAAFSIPSLREAKLKVKLGWPVWLYLTDYYNPAIFKDNDPVKGAPHCAEYPYLFDLFTSGNFLFDEDDIKMQNVILNSFANFVKKGDPSTKEIPWSQATVEKPLRNLRFRPEPQMMETMMEESVRFWESMDKYEYDIVAGRRKNTASKKDEL